MDSNEVEVEIKYLPASYLVVDRLTLVLRRCLGFKRPFTFSTTNPSFQLHTSPR